MTIFMELRCELRGDGRNEDNNRCWSDDNDGPQSHGWDSKKGADKNGIAYYSECCIGDKGVMEDEANNYNDYADSEDDCIHVIPLFTAAKPVEG
ncbi:hypothetical protein [Yersinia vastinensis]|uniref:hypothetical protein n=1 Tax=Yersinia vastinensis TaxID=2890318 RepID=UPI00384ECCEF